MAQCGTELRHPTQAFFLFFPHEPSGLDPCKWIHLLFVTLLFVYTGPIVKFTFALITTRGGVLADRPAS